MLTGHVLRYLQLRWLLELIAFLLPTSHSTPLLEVELPMNSVLLPHVQS
jgi:hypothetical protein